MKEIKFFLHSDFITPISEPDISNISVGSNILCLKYQRFTPSGCKPMRSRNFEFRKKAKFVRFRIDEKDSKLKSRSIFY